MAKKDSKRGFLDRLAARFTTSPDVPPFDASQYPSPGAPPAGSFEPDLSALTPEQRAQVEAVLAERDARLAKAQEDWQRHEDKMRGVPTQTGPTIVRPPTPEEIEVLRRGGPEAVQAALAAAQEMQAAHAQDALAQLPRSPSQAFDELLLQRPHSRPSPEDRMMSVVDEWQAREAAREPYLAQGFVAPVVRRIATTGERQLPDAIAWLCSSGLARRPDLVYSVHRLPVRLDPNIDVNRERSTPVEWEVVRTAPSELLVPVADPATVVQVTEFAADEQWLTRRAGEPSVIDEDVGAAVSAQAQLPPERCFGLARLTALRSRRSGSHEIHALIRGLGVLHAPSSAMADVRARLEAERPVAAMPVSGDVRVEVLDWDAVAMRVHRFRDHPPDAPSPAPHLPVTAQELLVAYLGIVGVAAHDTFTASVVAERTTRHDVKGLLSASQPCADGTSRVRLDLSSGVVLVYHDRPDYVAGRQRWATYQSEVLRLRVDHLSSVRLPVPTRGGLRHALERAQRVNDWLSDEFSDRREDEAPYCWPPID